MKLKQDKQEYDKNLSIDYEASIRYLVSKSNQRAWTVAFISIILCFLSIGAVILLTPLKTVQPYVIRVNETTGMVDIITTLKNKKVTESEAVNKFFISTYVKSRESYYYGTLQQDYYLVQLYSSPSVAKTYRSIYDGDNSRVKRLQNNFEVRIEINSIVLGKSVETQTATVRFTEYKRNLLSQTTTKTTKVATLTYRYVKNELKASDRLKNPLGFEVTSYRVDYETRG